MKANYDKIAPIYDMLSKLVFNRSQLLGQIEKLKNLKVLVINALREEPHDMHFNLKEALDFITLVQPKTTYLTHISHIMGFHEEVQKRLPENVFLAYDNLEITI